MARQDAFTQAYVEAALWSSMDNADEQGGDPLDKNYGPGDIAPATMAAMERDCADFQQKYDHLIGDDESAAIDKWGAWELAGHDFWLTRNGHGAGFGDGNFPKHDDELYAAAEAYGDFELYVGDDGVIYAFGHEEAAPPEAREFVRLQGPSAVRLFPSVRQSRPLREQSNGRLPQLVTGALSPEARRVYSAIHNGVQYEVYYDPNPDAARRSSRYGGSIGARRRQAGAHYAAVVYSPYEDASGNLAGVEAEQIAFGVDTAEAQRIAEQYIDKLTLPRSELPHGSRRH